VNWDGEYEPLNRLVLGVGGAFVEAAREAGCEIDREKELKIMGKLHEQMAVSAMPVQDAIDLARFLVETTGGYVRFCVSKQPKTVGGLVEIATITKHEGFKWVQRKHFYPTLLNPSS
jgi:hypothetical protein